MGVYVAYVIVAFITEDICGFYNYSSFHHCGVYVAFIIIVAFITVGCM